VESIWRAFHQHVSDPLAAAGIPLAVTPGNHDGSAYGGFELERAIYAEQWGPRRPQVRFLDDTGHPCCYAFEVGYVLFVSLDATVLGHLPPRQMARLRRVLVKHGTAEKRIVLFSHPPLWPFAQGREREFIGDPALQALLGEAHVELYLSGHHHAFYPGVKDGVAFVSQSCLGSGPRRLIGTEDKSAQSCTLLEIAEHGERVAAYAEPLFEAGID